MAEHKRTRLFIDANTKPILPRFVKLRHDEGRNRWVLLAPERILTPQETAVAILQECDGSRTVLEIATELATAYNAPQDLILSDTIKMLQDLADKGYIAS